MPVFPAQTEPSDQIHPPDDEANKDTCGDELKGDVDRQHGWIQRLGFDVRHENRGHRHAAENQHHQSGTEKIQRVVKPNRNLTNR